MKKSNPELTKHCYMKISNFVNENGANYGNKYSHLAEQQTYHTSLFVLKLWIPSNAHNHLVGRSFVNTGPAIVHSRLQR